jgi:hypothetical protein
MKASMGLDPLREMLRGRIREAILTVAGPELGNFWEQSTSFTFRMLMAAVLLVDRGVFVSHQRSCHGLRAERIAENNKIKVANLHALVSLAPSMPMETPPLYYPRGILRYG